MVRTKVAVLIGRDPAHRYSVHRGYVDALWAAGATPVLVTPPPADAPPHAVMRYVEATLDCQAVCVTGGGDVDPLRYAALPEEGLMDIDPARDRAEVATVGAATAAGLPVLGICRGIQLVTITLGGSLHQDLPRAGFTGHWDEERQHEPVHAIEADPRTLALAALAGATTVNSIHHQAVADAGPHLAASAWSPDGLIEAVEGPGVLGVQWHPERLWRADPRHLAPFRWLVSA
jgi:putative glutamine amidotransferase